jgi:hypothetical protein
MKKNPAGYIFLFAGIITYLGAYYDWPTYTKLGTTKWWVKMIGKEKTKKFTLLTSFIGGVIGVLILLGIIDFPHKR